MTKQQKTTMIDEKLRQVTDPLGNLMVDLFHYIALFAIFNTLELNTGSLPTSSVSI